MFPVGWQYLAVLAKKPEGLEKELSALSYDFDGDAEKDALYIIEDSELDLGLLDSVIRNLPRMLEILFGMKLHAPVQVRVADAEEIAKRSSAVFKPGTKQTSRVTGFAQKKNGMYQIVIENGSPRLAAIETMVSELRNR